MQERDADGDSHQLMHAAILHATRRTRRARTDAFQTRPETLVQRQVGAKPAEHYNSENPRLG